MRTTAVGLTILFVLLVNAACEETDASMRWSRQVNRASNPVPQTADWIPLPSPVAPQRAPAGRVLTYPQQPAQVTQFFPEPPYALIGEPFLLRPPPPHLQQQQHQQLQQHQQHQQQQQQQHQQQPLEEHVQLLYVPLETIRRRTKYPNFTPPSPRAVNDFYQSSTPPAPQTTTQKSKQKPHQPPLAMFMSKHTETTNPLNDVLALLQSAKTIDVLDNISSKKPSVFVGPSALKVPSEYVRFDLPYLSNIEHNRVERRIENVPFFVAPLSYKAPQGYAKIPFPSPHVGSVVVRPAQFDITTTAKPRLHPNDFVPLSHAAYVTQLAQGELSATEQYNIRNYSTEKPNRPYDNVQAQNPQQSPVPTFQTQYEDDAPQKVATRSQLEDAYPVHSTLRPPFESFKQELPKTTTDRPYSPLEHFKNLYSTVQAQRSTATPYDASQIYQSNNNKHQGPSPTTNYNAGYSEPVPKITREQLFKEPARNAISHEQINDNTQQQSIQQSTSRQQFETAQDLKKYNYEKGNKQRQNFANGQSVTYSQFGPHTQHHPQQFIRQEIVHQVPKQQQYPTQSVIFQPQETPNVQINGEDGSKYQQSYVGPSVEQYQQQYIVSTSEQPKPQQNYEQYVGPNPEQPNFQQQSYKSQFESPSSSQPKTGSYQSQFPSTVQPSRQQYEQQQYIVSSSEKPKQQQVYQQQEVVPSRQPDNQFAKQYGQEATDFGGHGPTQVYEPQVTEHSIIEQYNRQYNQAFESLSRPTAVPTQTTTTEIPTTTTKPYVEEHHTSRYTEFAPYQPSPTQPAQVQHTRQPSRASTHRPRNGSKQRGSQRFRDSIRQDYPDSVQDAFIEITKEQKPQDNYYDMKQYFKQQTAFHPLDVNSRTSQQAENDTIKYSLPPELPAISEMLPGLINSLQDATKPYDATTTPIPETTTPQFVRRPVSSRGRRPTPTRQSFRETTSRRAPVRRRPTYQTRTSSDNSKSYNGRYQSRHNSNHQTDEITTEAQRKPLYRHNYRGRTRTQVIKHREEEEEKPNYPDPLPVKTTAAPIVDIVLKNTEPLYSNPETRVEEYIHEEEVVTTESPQNQQYSTPDYDIVSKSDDTVMIITPSTVDAVKYTPQIDVVVNNEDVVVNTSPSAVNNEEQNAATEVYGFTREPNFPPVVDQTSKYQIEEVSEDIRPVYAEEERLTTSTRRSNFLRRSSRLSTTTPSTLPDVTTEYVDNHARYTVKPGRKIYTSTQVPRTIKIRGRIRKPSTTTTERVDNEVIDSTPKPIIHRFISRPRTTTTPVETTESAKSSFRITVGPEDQTNFETVHRSHYVNLDTAESQWSTKVNENSFQPVDKPTKLDEETRQLPKADEVEIITAGDVVDTFMFTVTPGTPKETSTNEMSFMELLKDVAGELSATTNETSSEEEEKNTPLPMRKRGYWRRVRVKPVNEDALVASESQRVQSTYLNSLQAPEKGNYKQESKLYEDTLSFTTEKSEPSTVAFPDTTQIPVQQQTTVFPEEIKESDPTVLPTENIDKTTEEERYQDVMDGVQTEMPTTDTPLMKRIEDILHVIHLDNVDNLDNLESVTNHDVTTEAQAPVTEADPIGSAIVVTSTSTVITHETEICYRGRCVKNPKSQKN